MSNINWRSQTQKEKPAKHKMKAGNFCLGMEGEALDFLGLFLAVAKA